MEILIFKPSKLLCVCWWLCDSYKRENTRHSLKLSVFDLNRIIGASPWPSKSFAITLGDGTKWKTWSFEWVDGCMTCTREWKIGGSDLLERGGWVGSHRIWWQTIGSGSNEWELEKATWKPPKEEEDHLMSCDIIEKYHELEGRGRRGLVVQCCRVSLQPWEAAVGKQAVSCLRRAPPPTSNCCLLPPPEREEEIFQKRWVQPPSDAVSTNLEKCWAVRKVGSFSKTSV